MKVERRIGYSVLAVLLSVLFAACASTSMGGGAGDRNRITAEELTDVDVSTLYEVVQRLRPRWLEARGPRSIDGETQVVVIQDRTYLGGVDQLRDLGMEVAEWLEYRSGVDVAGELYVPGDRHIEGAIIVHTGDSGR